MSVVESSADDLRIEPWWTRKDVLAITTGLILIVSVLFWWSLNIRVEAVDYIVGMVLHHRPPPLMIIPLLLGSAVVAYGIVAGRHRVLPLVLTPLLILAMLWVAPYRIYAPKLWFAVHKPMYEAALAVDPGVTYYGAPLPGLSGILSVTGNVSGEDGDRFFPLWTGIPDDAGGFIHSTRDPSGRFDMYGAMCVHADDLGDSWWMCGM